MARTLEVRIVGDERQLARTFGRASRDAKTFGSSLRGHVGGGLKAVALGVGGAAAAVGYFGTKVLRGAIDSMNEHDQAAAQTVAAIRSTGGAAHVSSGHVAALADKIEKLSGQDDVAVQSGENMLLTFTRIRNEVGHGNNIFDRATLATANLSAKMGIAMPRAAVMLGKALNDPVRGVTALSRIGVTFTKGQVAQIKALEKSGQHLKAQKLILGELNREFGGSAKAMGQTLPGKINRLKAYFDDFAQDLLGRVRPSLNAIVTWTITHWPQIRQTIESVMNRVASAIGTAVGFVRAHWSQIVGAFNTARAAVIRAMNAISAGVRAVWPRIVSAARSAIAYYRSTIAPAFSSIASAARAIWSRFGSTITSITKTAFTMIVGFVRGGLQYVKGIITAVLAAIHGDWGKAWEALKSAARGAFSAIASIVRGFASITFEAAKAVGKAILDGVLRLAQAAPGKISALAGKIPGAISSAAGAVASAAISLGGKLVDSFMASARALPGRIGNVMAGVAGSIASWAGSIASAAWNIGSDIVSGILSGAGGLLGRLKDWLESQIKGAITSVSPFSPIEVGAARYLGAPIVEGALKGSASLASRLKRQLSSALVSAIRDAKQNAVDLSGGLIQMFDQAYDADSPKAKRLRRLQEEQARIQRQREAEQVKGDLATANARVDAFKKAGDTSSDDYKQALADQKAAQQAYDDWVLQTKIDQAQAEADKDKADKERRIADLQDEFNRGKITAEQYRKALEKILGKGRGASLGAAFMHAFMAQIAALLKQIRQIEAAAGGATGSGNPGPTTSDPGHVLADWKKARKAYHDSLVKKAHAKSSPGGAKITAAEDAEIKKAMRAWDKKHPRPLAAGGILTGPTFANGFVGGEAGREAVLPLDDPASVRLLRRALAPAGGVTIVFNETPADASPRAIAAAVSWTLRTMAV